MTKRLFYIALVLLLPLMLLWGNGPVALALSAEQQLFNEAWQVVQQAYVDDSFNHQNWRLVRQRALKQPLPDRNATYTAIQAMLAGLDDPFTRFLPPAQYRSLQASTAGELTGVGLQISLNDATGYLEVLAPVDGSPAAIAGIQPKDQILRIDGASTKELTIDEAAERMRGPIGTSVVLQIKRLDNRQGSQLLQVPLRRDLISINPVKAEVRQQPNGETIGYIRLRQFSAKATQEMTAAMEHLESQGVAGYILDLRNNPGGLLQAGVDIARLWLDPSPIVYTVDRQGVLNSFSANERALTHTPLVVLVNKGSASASEILAGALKDHARAQLVGEQTFGKGSIQSLFNLSDGSGLAVTIAKYETPNHHNINKVGIPPNQVVPMDPLKGEQVGTASDPQYSAALELLTSTSVMAGVS